MPKVVSNEQCLHAWGHCVLHLEGHLQLAADCQSETAECDGITATTGCQGFFWVLVADRQRQSQSQH